MALLALGGCDSGGDDGKSDAKAETKADAKADAKADEKADEKADAKADEKADAKADEKPAEGADAKAAEGADEKPAEGDEKAAGDEKPTDEKPADDKKADDKKKAKKPSGPSAAEGKPIYMKKCKTCHGADGKGKTKMGEKHNIEPLSKAKKSKIAKIIANGIEGTKMKAFKGKLSDKEIAAVTAFVKTL